MAYTIVNGNGANNFFAFQGVVDNAYDRTFVNPYTGYTVTVTGSKNVNNAVYDGMGGTDTLSMTSLGDILTLTDGNGTVMVKNVEQFQAGDDGDVIILADGSLGYGDATLRGSDGGDILWANNGNDLLFGETGNDIMDGGGGNDYLFGGDDDDYVSGGAGTDIVFGGAGNDTLIYNVDGIWSGGYTLASLGSAIPFAALVNLDGKNQSYDTFNGDATESQTVGARGIDTLLMTDGDDVLVISDTVSPINNFFYPRVAEIEVIEAGDGNDIVDLSGEPHQDVTIHGGNGDDILAGSIGNDTITGDDGNDRLFGAGGNDTLSGGTGDDTYYYRAGDGNDTIVETSGNDTISFGPGITMDNITFTVSGNDLKITVGADTITIQNQFAADGSGRVENLTFDDNTSYDLGARGVPAAPVANADHVTGNEDTVITGNVLTNDTDANGDTLSVAAQTFTTALGGSVVLNADGSFTYQGAENFNGSDSFTYTVTDGTGHSVTGTVDLDVQSVNDAPVAGAYSFSGDEDTVITGTLLSHDTDVDGDALSAVAQTITTAQGGSVTINADGTFSYTGAANFNGADNFTYTVSDGHGGTDTGSVSLTVNAVNDAPAAGNDSFSGQEDQPVTGNVLTNDTDVDGDVLSAVAQTLATAQGGSVTINADGTFTYQGAENFNGADGFDYTVTDGNGGTSVGHVDLSVAAVNDAPVAADDVFSGQEDQPVTGNVLANDTDVDGDALSISAQTITTAHGGTVTLSADGSFSYTGAVDYNGSDSFTYTAQDGHGGVATGHVDLSIAAVNDAPVAADDIFSGQEDQPVTGNILTNDTDVDGDVLSAIQQTLTTAQGGSVTINTDGTFTYQGAENFNGSDGFNYTVADGNGGTSIGHVDLQIGAVNDAPEAQNDSFSGMEDQPVTGNVLINDTDVDGDTLSALQQTLTTAQGGSVTINADGTFSYTGAENFNGADGFDYTVTDGNGGSSVGHVDLQIGAVNDAPVANDDVFTGQEDTIITGNVLANDTDVDGDTLSVAAQTITTAHGGTVMLSTDGSFSYAGAANYNGSDSFTYTAQDGHGGAALGTVLLGIAAVNDAPAAQDDSFNGLRNAALLGNVLVNDTDVDGDTLSVQAATVATAQGGTVTLNADGSFTYVAADGFFGQDSFDYTAIDGNGGSDTATVSLNIALDPAHSTIGTETGETIDGTAADNEIFGLGGDDTIKGMGGNDTVFGGDGNDVLYGDDSILTGTVYNKQFSDTIVMPTLKEGVNITNLRPKGDPALGINEGNLTVDHAATASITFRQGAANNDNSFGVFGIAADGTIVQSTMEWANVKTAGIDVAHDVTLPVGIDGGAFGFFIVSDGNNANHGYSGLNITGEGNIKFIYDYGKADQRDAKITDAGSKVSIVYDDGHTVKVLSGDVYFTTDRGASTAINEDGKVHVVSGLMDTNNLTLDPHAADLASRPVTLTKDDITVSALSGTLIAHGDSIGVKTSASGDTIGGSEGLHVGFAQGADKVTVSLSDIAGNGRGIDFKIYLDGDTAHPVSYEYVVNGAPSGGKLDIVLNGADFGGHITGFDISSVSNSGHGTETFYFDNVLAEIPGGTDTNTLRIGFEDLKNAGDADYQDVLFDLDIKPVTLADSTGGNDYLDGGAGNDTLYGEGGNDILVIGLGLDHATGGAGADTFALKNIDANADVIHDFNRAEGDVINITDVLEHYDPLHDDISHFVHLVQNGADTQVQINATGDDHGAFVTAAIILGGVGGESLSQLVSEGAIVANHAVTHA